jgi:glycerol-3-phosphate dehydrogenase
MSSTTDAGTPGALNPAQRQAAWDALVSEEWDVLVVGGGVTGAGVALDAATRGLKVALVESRDLASGTSSRSSKLFHGGLRYLEMLDFGLVREALHERDLMLEKLAPHLVTPVPFLYPLKHRGWERPYVGAGLLLYDALAGRSPMPRHRHLTRRQALRRSPALRPTALTGALQYYDAATDDARHTLTLARTAAFYGATVRTSTEVTGLVIEGSRVVGAHLRDVEDGRTGTVRARVVVGCTGVWSDFLHEMAGVPSPYRVRASKGVHLLVPRDRIESSTGLILRTEKSVLFVIPWGEHWVVGTTDTPWDLSLEHPAATRADIDYILDRVNEVLLQPITDDDIVGVYVGLRPLLAPADADSQSTTKLSREHQVAHPLPGLVTVAGGKYTTYRVMAEDTVDEAMTDLPVVVPPSVTEDVPLLGAAGYHATRNREASLASRYSLSREAVARMVGRYGDLVEEVLAPTLTDASLAQPVPGAPQYLMAEMRYAATHEGALHLDDLLARRTRISVDTVHRGVDSARAVASLVAPLLGWSAEREQEEIDAYLQRVERERASQALPTDDVAQSVRSQAPDSRPMAAGRKVEQPQASAAAK